MKPHRDVYVLGGAHTTYLGRARPEFVPPKAPGRNPTLEEHLHGVVRDALESTGVPAEAVERGWVSNFLAECFTGQGHLGSMLAGAHPAFDGKPFLRVEAACASGSTAVISAIDAMQAGCDIALVAGVEVETNVRGRDGVEYMARAAHYERSRSFPSQYTFPWMFARRQKAYKQAWGVDHDVFARVVHKAYANARRNPLALHHHTELDWEHASTVHEHNRTFLEDPELHDHMRILESTEFTDGASAVLLATEDGLRRLGIDRSRCTRIRSYGWSTRALQAEADPTRMANIADASAIAYRDAAIGPADVQVAEVHDCFAVSELQQIEALGFADLGRAGPELADGAFDVDGRVPVNTGGGLLGFGHPIGATGVKQVLEIWRQMQGACGAYQITRRPRFGVTSNLGGDDRTGVVIVHEAC